MNKTEHAPGIFTLPQVFTPLECENYLLFSEHRGYEEATVSLPSGPRMIKGIRNNYRLIYTDAALAQKLFDRIKPTLPPELEGWHPIGLNEQFRFYRYDLKQRFNKHVDGRFTRSENEESRLTFMVYLNDDFEGGETEFDTVTIQPETGMGLVFVHELKHKGCAVTQGTKYVLRTDVMYGR